MNTTTKHKNEIETLTTSREGARAFGSIAIAKKFADKFCAGVPGCLAVVLAGKTITIEMSFNGVKHYFA